MFYIFVIAAVVGSTIGMWLGFNHEEYLGPLAYAPGLLFGALIAIPLRRGMRMAKWRVGVLVAASTMLFVAAFLIVPYALDRLTGSVLAGPIELTAAIVSAVANGILLVISAFLIGCKIKPTLLLCAVLAACAGGALIGAGFTVLSGGGLNLYMGPRTLAFVMAGFAITQGTMAMVIRAISKDSRIAAQQRAV